MTPEDQVPGDNYELVNLGGPPGNEWELAPPLADFFNKHASQFLSAKILKEAITDDLPVPANLHKRPKLDEFATTLIRNNNWGTEPGKVLSKDVELGDVWDKVVASMGPLGKVWQDLEDYMLGKGAMMPSPLRKSRLLFKRPSS